MAVFGLSEDDYEPEQLLILPDNWQSVCIFNSLSTQWRVGYSGPTGLDYAVLDGMFKLAGVKKKDRPQVFADIRIMESAALTVMHQKE